SLNLQRRHLDRKQKREYIAACLRHTPELSDNWLGELCGADRKTVGAGRSELVARWEIPNVEGFRGKDGKRYRFTTGPTETAAHARRAAGALRRLGGQPRGRVIKVGGAARLARRLEHERHRQGPAPPAPKHFHLACCDFRDLGARDVDLIFTDP